METMDAAGEKLENFEHVKRVISLYNDVEVPEIEIVKYAKSTDVNECWVATEAVFEYLMTGIMPPVVEKFLSGRVQADPRTLKELFFQHSPVRIVGDTYAIRQRPVLAGVLLEEVVNACRRYASFEDDFDDFMDSLSSLVDFLVEPDLEFSHAVKLAKNIESQLIASFFLERALNLIPEEVRKDLPMEEMFYLISEIQNNGKLVVPTPASGDPMAARGPGAPGGSDPEYFAAAVTPSGGEDRAGVEARNFFGGGRASGPEPLNKPEGDYSGPGDVKVKLSQIAKKAGGALRGAKDSVETFGPRAKPLAGEGQMKIKGRDSVFGDPSVEAGIKLYRDTLEKFLLKNNIPTFKGMKKVMLKDLIGMDDLKKQTLLEPFINTIYVAQGETVHANPVILLNGPPGTGKSFSMIALANEIGANVEIINGATIKNEFVGRTEKNFVRLIESAIRSYDRTGQLSMILLDEAETLLPRKNTDNKSSQDILPLFNSYTSGPKKDDIEGKVVFVLTINNMDAIDPSVLNRAHRIEYEKPEVAEIKELFIQHTAGRGARADLNNINWEAVAGKAEGLVQRDIVHICGAAKTAALARQAEELNFSLYTADEGERYHIANTYLITQGDLEKVTEKKVKENQTKGNKRATEVMYG